MVLLFCSCSSWATPILTETLIFQILPCFYVLYASHIYPGTVSRCIRSIFSVSIMCLSTFDPMPSVEEHVFRPVISFILLCMPVLSMIISFSNPACFSLRHSYFSCLHLFLIFYILGIICCLSFIIPNISYHSLLFFFLVSWDDLIY